MSPQLMYNHELAALISIEHNYCMKDEIPNPQIAFDVNDIENFSSLNCEWSSTFDEISANSPIPQNGKCI